jgi:hypothetical protein
MANARFKHPVSVFTWIVPTCVLFYRLLVFPTSVFDNHFLQAFQYFFNSHFSIREYNDYADLFRIAKSNADLIRGIDQMRFTAPFYAGLAYSMASWVFLRISRTEVSPAKRRSYFFMGERH